MQIEAITLLKTGDGERGGGLTARQKSEVDYHIDYAERHRNLASEPVALEVCMSERRRWWNAYWSFYDLIRKTPLAGKRVLVPGCGFGEDCIRISARGADVYGIDISPPVVEIARIRAQNFAKAPITLTAMPCERLEYPDQFFDAIVLVNILHHVDIPQTMAEVRRVAKPGAHILGLEMYTHTLAQRVRQSAFFSKIVYPRVVGRIYHDDPYITPDERKIDENELSAIVGGLENCRMDYFSIFAERFFSNDLVSACRMDRQLARALGGLSRFVAGRVIFSGIWRGDSLSEEPSK
jgi:ubiquinone/menaquinone biosynthesis C-methylase UbiE